MSTTKLYRFLLLPLLAALAVAPLAGENCVYDWSVHYDKLSRLVNHYTPATGDSVTIPTWDPLMSSVSGDEVYETWYIARDDLGYAPMGPLNRFQKSSPTRHADDPDPSFSGYSLDQLQGFAWESSSRPGLSVMRRYVAAGAADYRTWLFSQTPAGYTTNETWWGTSPEPRFGYQRFGNAVDLDDVLAAGYGTYTLENSQLKVELNHIWGNAIGKITHKGTGKQIVSEPIGDMVQGLIRFGSGQGTNVCRIPNPTQSGGADCSNYSNRRLWAGSPLISVAASGSNPSTLTSVVQPLEFCHEDQAALAWPDTQGENPLIWKGYFERTDTLGCKLGNLRQDVVKMSTRVRLANYASISSLGGTTENSYWLAVKAWGDARANNFAIEVVNAKTGALVQTLDYWDPIAGAPDWNGSNWALNNPGYPIAVRIRVNNAFTIGIVRLDSEYSGSGPDPVNDYTTIWLRCPTSAQPTCNVNQQYLIVGFRRRQDTYTKSYGAPLDSFLVVNGSQSEVDIRIMEIYNDGGNCLN